MHITLTETSRITGWKTLRFTGAILIILSIITPCMAENTGKNQPEGRQSVEGKNIFRITSYCECHACTGKYPTDPSYGIMADGRVVHPGAIASGWLPFGTMVQIGNEVFTVEDRGAKSIFGSKDNHIKALDIYMPTHEQAKQYGVQYREVKILLFTP